MNWTKLLEQLKIRLNCNEAELAAALGISRSMFSQCRMGIRPLPATVKIRLLDRLGYRLTRKAILSALPSDLATAVHQADDSHFQKRLARKVVNTFLEKFDSHSQMIKASFFKRLCDLGGCEMSALSELLEVEGDTLSKVADGKEQLPFWAKQAVVDNFDVSDLSDLVDQLSHSNG